MGKFVAEFAKRHVPGSAIHGEAPVARGASSPPVDAPGAGMAGDPRSGSAAVGVPAAFSASASLRPAPSSSPPLNPYAPPAEGTFVSPPQADSNVEEIRRRYLNREASIRSVGALYLFGGGFLAVVSPFALVGDGPRGIMLFVFLFMFVWGVAQLLVGHGLRLMAPWSRLPTMMFQAIGLLGFPIGTLISGYILYLVGSKDGAFVLSTEYQEVVRATPHIRYKTSIVVWIVLGLLVLSLLAAGVVAAMAG